MDGVRLEKRKIRLGESELPCAESDLAEVGCQRTGWTCRFSGPQDQSLWVPTTVLFKFPRRFLCMKDPDVG